MRTFLDFFAAWVKNTMLVFMMFFFAFCGIIMGYQIGNDPLMIFSIVICVLMVIAYIIGRIGAKKIKNNITIVNESTINVALRSSDNRRMFRIIKYVEQYFQYHPATATFTAVSVGGVTTGGWDVRDAHFTMQSGASTDKSLLMFYPMDDRKGVEPIVVGAVQLSNNDAAVARQNGFLRDFMPGNKGETLFLRRKSSGRGAAAADRHYRNTGDMYGAMNLASKDYTESLLTRKELERVVDFLCGK